MRKCPRCGQKINENEKYCPHCGLDLNGRYRPIQKKKTSYMIYIVIIFCMVIVPMLYGYLLSSLGNDLTSTKTNVNGKTELPQISNEDAYMIVETYDTLADFRQQFTNVDGIVNAIEAYGTSLEATGYTFDKEYYIAVLDNYNISFSLKYTTQINDQLSLRIEKLYDRGHTTNTEKIVLRKTGATSFEELFLTDEEKAVLTAFVGEQTVVDSLVEQFSARADEFEQKKEKLGHFGMGEYEGKSSFVVYRNQETYYSELIYSYQPDDYIY